MIRREASAHSITLPNHKIIFFFSRKLIAKPFEWHNYFIYVNVFSLQNSVRFSKFPNFLLKLYAIQLDTWFEKKYMKN